MLDKVAAPDLPAAEALRSSGNPATTVDSLLNRIDRLIVDVMAWTDGSGVRRSVPRQIGR